MRLRPCLLLLILPVLMACSKADEAAELGTTGSTAAAVRDTGDTTLALSAKASGQESMPTQNGASAPAIHQAVNTVLQQRSVIRRASLTIRVKDIEQAEKQVQAVVNQVGGYVETASSTDLASEHPILTIQMRVPVQAFDGVLSKIESFGVRLAKTISSEDVTTQIVDLDARLKTLSAQEETFRGLLKRTTNLQNVIELQDKLTQVRGDIESMSAQRKTLAGLSSLSTVSLTLEQSSVPAAAPKDPNWLAEVWGQATTSLGGFARNLASVGIWAFVFCPIWIPILWLARSSWKNATRGARGLGDEGMREVMEVMEVREDVPEV